MSKLTFEIEEIWEGKYIVIEYEGEKRIAAHTPVRRWPYRGEALCVQPPYYKQKEAQNAKRRLEVWQKQD